MFRDTSKLWSMLAQWSAMVFLIAGGLLVVHAVFHVLIAFTSVGYPFHHEFPFGLAGMILGFIALVGLYPQLVARSPKLGRTGVGFALLGTIGWIGLGMRTILDELGVTPPTWLGLVAPLVIFGVILSYLVFGFAGYRTNIVTPTTAIIIITPALVMVYNLVSAIALPDFTGAAVIVATGFALAHLAIGAALRHESYPPSNTDTANNLVT